MTGAIFGLIGVLVGGVLNGVVGAWQGRRLEHFETRAAARLVFHDLVNAKLLLQEATSRGSWGEVTDELLRLDRWTEYERLFARALDSDEWLALQFAVSKTRELSRLAPIPQQIITERMDQEIAGRASQATERAISVLIDLATDGPYPGVWHRARRRARRTWLGRRVGRKRAKQLSF
jgi:hypothetical protein